MSPELLQIIVQLGSTGVAVWFLQQVWTELKIQNERIYLLLEKQDKAAAERENILSHVDNAKENPP